MQRINTQPSKQNTAQMQQPSPYFNYDDIFIYNNDILKITDIPQSSIDLIVTSPPYNVDIHYNAHKDNLSYDAYLEFTEK